MIFIKVENGTGVKIIYKGTHCPAGKPTYTTGVKVTL